MGKPRKTYPVALFRERANYLLANKDTRRTFPEGMTHEQVYRLAWASALEMILMDTGNYRGFGYLDMTPDGEGGWDVPDESRRVYYGY